MARGDYELITQLIFLKDHFFFLKWQHCSAHRVDLIKPTYFQNGINLQSEVNVVIHNQCLVLY